jgi:predicted GNAT family N-acyltransferase
MKGSMKKTGGMRFMPKQIEFIHVLSEAELKECFRIRYEVFVREQGVSEELEWDEKDRAPGACRHFLLKRDGVAIGTARWYGYDAETAKLQRVAVLQAFRGIGAGKRIIGELEEDARQNGFSYAMLDGQCQAEEFYRKLGYAVISDEPFYDAGILHVRMKKTLSLQAETQS